MGVGRLNRFWGPGEGNLTAENQKSQMPGGLPRGLPGGMLMFQIDRRIMGSLPIEARIFFPAAPSTAS